METDAEEILAINLKNRGFHVEKIPHAKNKTPDFFASKNNDNYLIEVKSKIPSKEVDLARKTAFDAGDIFETIEPISRLSKHSKIISTAKNQLIANGSENTFKIICLICLGHNAEANAAQFEASLYGSTNVSEWTGNSPLLPCYYFRHSDFYKYRSHIDGAIVMYDRHGQHLQAKLCLNDHSTKYELLKFSELQKIFGTAIVDPQSEEKNNNAYIVDGNIDRNSPNHVLDYLKTKYTLGPLTNNMDMNFISAEIAVKDKK